MVFIGAWSRVLFNLSNHPPSHCVPRGNSWNTISYKWNSDSAWLELKADLETRLRTPWPRNWEVNTHFPSHNTFKNLSYESQILPLKKFETCRFWNWKVTWQPKQLPISRLWCTIVHIMYCLKWIQSFSLPLMTWFAEWRISNRKKVPFWTVSQSYPNKFWISLAGEYLGGKANFGISKVTQNGLEGEESTCRKT